MQTGIPGGPGVAIKFEPRFRKETIVRDEEERKAHLEELNREIEEYRSRQMNVEEQEVKKEEAKVDSPPPSPDADVEINPGFSLVNY